MFKKLSKVKSNDSIIYGNMPANPGAHCPMHTSLSSIRKLDGVSSLVIGMPECTFYSRYVVNKSSNNTLHYSYILDGNEVVFGSAENIKEAMIEMVKDGAKNIIVIKTCIPSLIGEDIEQMASDVNEDYHVKFVVLDLAHYKTNGYTTGFELTTRALMQFIEKNTTTQVNLLGDMAGEEYEDLKLHISTKYKCFSFGYKNNYTKFQLLGKGQYNIVFSANFIQLAIDLERMFGIPYVYFSGVNKEDIVKSYELIESMLHMKLKRNYAYPEIDLTQKECSYISIFNSVDAVELVGILDEFKFNCVFTHVEEYTPAVEIIQHKMKYSDPDVAYISDTISFLENCQFSYDICLNNNIEVLEALSCIGMERIYKIQRYMDKIGGIKNATI